MFVQERAGSADRAGVRGGGVIVAFTAAGILGDPIRPKGFFSGA